MLEMMKLAISMLKERVAQNLDTIKQNERMFQKMMSVSGDNQNSGEMSQLLECNEALLAENFDFINLQLSMLKFIENHQGHENIVDADVDKAALDTLGQTIDILGFTANGKIAFDLKHPLLYDEYFWGRLVQHFYMEDNDDKVSNVLSTLLQSRLN
jgi:uncharacterized protein YigA (DUF484 family)